MATVTAEPAARGHSTRVPSARALTAFLLLAPILVCVVLPAAAFKVTDTDYWWHVRTGQLIIESGHLPQGDPYSHTALGQPWLLHEWLSEVGFYVVHSTVGYAGNVVLFGLLAILTCLAMFGTCREWGLGELGCAFLMTWAFVLLRFSFNVRAQVYTTLLLSVTAWLLTRYRKRGTRLIWALPFVFILWVNLHGGYIIGLALMGLNLVGEAISARLGRSEIPLRPLFVLTLLCFAAVLLNPYGIQALTYPFSYAGVENPSMQYIQEWQSPNFHFPELFVLLAGILLSMILGLLRPPLGITDALAVIAFTAMSLLSMRHVQLYGIIVLPILGARVQHEVPSLHRSIAEWKRPAVLGVLWPVLIVFLVKLYARTGDGDIPLQIGREPSSQDFPAGAVAYLAEHDTPGNLFNAYRWGGYLIYNLYPDVPVFIDGRADVYGQALMDDYGLADTASPEWHTVLDRHEVGTVLVRADAALASVADAHASWFEVYANETAVIYCAVQP